MGPVPGRRFADTFQLLAVSPALDTGELWKVITDESNVKSPWNPTRLSAPFMVVVVASATKSVINGSSATLLLDLSTVWRTHHNLWTLMAG